MNRIIMVKFGYTNELLNEPIIYALKSNLISHPFKLIEMPQADILKNLENKSIDMGLISPLQYAINRGKIKICRDITICSSKSGRNILLFFQGNLEKITKIFYKKNPLNSYEHLMGEIVINEFLNVEADWIEVNKFSQIDLDLDKFPVIFLSGYQAFNALGIVETYIDLSEEWIIQTELPFIHRILAVRDDFKDFNVMDTLKLSLELGLRNIKKIAENFDDITKKSWDIYTDLLRKNYQYYYSEEPVWKSLREILSFIFYYGKSEYLPDLKFWD